MSALAGWYVVWQSGRWLLMQEGPLQKEMTDPDEVEFAVWTYFLLFLNSLLPCPKKSRWGRTFYGHYFVTKELSQLL